MSFGGGVGRFKKPPFIPKKRSAPRPAASPSFSTTISVEALVEETEEEQEIESSAPWFASFKTIVWINFALTIILFVLFVAVFFLRSTPPTPTPSSSPPPILSKKEERSLSFNLISSDVEISLKSSGVDISQLKNIWVCCTKKGIYSCHYDVSVLVETLEARVSIKHPDRIGATCWLHWM
jgi:hypothetical protein